MEHEFTQFQMVLIHQNFKKLTDEEIATIINIPIHLVHEKINHITNGGTIQKSKTQKLLQKQKVKSKQETKKIITHQRVQMSERRKQMEAPKFKTPQIDYSKMISVRIDHKTTIYIKPGQNPEEEKIKYLKQRANK